jgi:hypothetical protein
VFWSLGKCSVISRACCVETIIRSNILTQEGFEFLTITPQVIIPLVCRASVAVLSCSCYLPKIGSAAHFTCSIRSFHFLAQLISPNTPPHQPTLVLQITLDRGPSVPYPASQCASSFNDNCWASGNGS